VSTIAQYRGNGLLHEEKLSRRGSEQRDRGDEVPQCRHHRLINSQVIEKVLVETCTVPVAANEAQQWFAVKAFLLLS